MKRWTLSGPYFIVEGQDASIHEFLGDVEAFLETYDVEAGRLRLFRADGAELKLTTTGPPPPSGARLRRVVATEEVVGHDPATLAKALRAGLLAEHKGPLGRRTQPGIDREAIEQADLEVLVEEFRRAAAGHRTPQ